MKKSISFNVLSLSIGLAALTAAPSTGWTKMHPMKIAKRDIPGRPQVFKAQEEDGTAQVIKANTNIDADKPKEEFMGDPQHAAVTEADEVAMEGRLKALEEAKTEVKEQAKSASPDPAAVDV